MLVSFLTDSPEGATSSPNFLGPAVSFRFSKRQLTIYFLCDRPYRFALQLFILLYVREVLDYMALSSGFIGPCLGVIYLGVIYLGVIYLELNTA
jgi:hypothetical protein